MSLAKCLSVVALAFGLALAPFGGVHAQDAFIGSWVLDAARSNAGPGLMPTSATLELTAAGGGQYKSVSEATMAGINTRSEVTFAVDGKDYAVASTPTQPGTPALTQSIERVSDTVYKSSIKIGGQVIATALNEISGDGNTLTLTTTGIGQFAAISSTMVLHRK